MLLGREKTYQLTDVGGFTTVNAYSGSVAVSAGDAQLTLTDSKILATSTIIATYQDLAAKGPLSVYVTALTAGHTTITYSAAIPALATATINFIILNQ